jgi:ubiquinone/menaquinone biosynthesis C-methylase UbiE
MCLSSFFRSQFASPSGLFGSLFVAPFLNITSMGLIRASIDLLEPKPDDRVLDIGFGGGYSLLALAERVPNGQVVGVDHSRDMVEAAANLIRGEQLQSRIRVRRGNVAKLPFAASTFDRVLTVNTIYYWPDVRAGLGEIARVLKPGGRLVVGFRSPGSLRLVTLTWNDFRRCEPQEVSEAMRKAGFRLLRVAHPSLWRMPDNVVLIGDYKKRSARRPVRKAIAVAKPLK